MPDARQARLVADFTRFHHVAAAYAGYWEAMALTWQSHFAFQVYPVRMCDDQGRPCAFEYHRISS